MFFSKGTRGNRLAYILIAPLTALAIASCNERVSDTELTRYIKDPQNGLFHEKTVNEVTCQVYYRPADFVVKLMLGAEDTITPQKEDSLRGEAGKQLCFIISVSRNGTDALESFSTDRATYSAMVQQMAFGLNEQVILTTNLSDTLQLLDYVYPRTYGYSSAASMLFAFERKDLQRYEWLSLLVKDFGLKTGDLRFKFYTKDIQGTPELNFELNN